MALRRRLQTARETVERLNAEIAALPKTARSARRRLTAQLRRAEQTLAQLAGQATLAQLSARPHAPARLRPMTVTIDVLGDEDIKARLSAVAATPESLQILAAELVAELGRGDDQRGPRGSKGRRPKRKRRTTSWPYDTGRSRRSFYATVSGNRISIRNRAAYAKYVEEGASTKLTRGSARRQLQKALPRILEDVEAQLARGFNG